MLYLHPGGIKQSRAQVRSKPLLLHPCGPITDFNHGAMVGERVKCIIMYRHGCYKGWRVPRMFSDSLRDRKR
jgi:hypothetical protein